MNALLSALNNSLQKVHAPVTTLSLFKELFPDWMTYAEWESCGKPKGKGKHLYPWQEQVLHQIFDPLISEPETEDIPISIALAGANGIGKTVFLAVVILLHLYYCYKYERKRDYSGAVFSGSQDQLRQTLWRNVTNLAVSRGFTCLKEEISIAPSFTIYAKTVNKSNIDSVQGIHAENVLVIFDEGTAICDEMYDKARSFKTSSRFVWIVAGNPFTTSGRFYELFHRDYYLETWKSRHISVFDSSPDGHHFEREIAALYGKDSDEYRMYILGQFALAESSSFFHRYMVERAAARIIPDTQSRTCLGIDVASGRGKDYSVIAVRNSMKIVEIYKSKISIPDFKRVINDYIHHYNPTFIAIDNVGLGEGPFQDLCEGLRHTGVRIIPVNGGSNPVRNMNCVNRRTELLFLMKDWMNDIGGIPNRASLHDELVGLTYYNTKKGKLEAITKKELSKSPDEVDACAYTFADYIETLPPSKEHYQKMYKKLGFVGYNI